MGSISFSRCASETPSFILPDKPSAVQGWKESKANHSEGIYIIVEQVHMMTLTTGSQNEALVALTAERDALTNDLAKKIAWKAELTAERVALKIDLAKKIAYEEKLIARLVIQNTIAEKLADEADLIARRQGLKSSRTNNLARNPELLEMLKLRKDELARIKAEKKADRLAVSNRQCLGASVVSESMNSTSS